MEGLSLCIHGFLEIIQLDRATLQRHRKEVANSLSVDTYDTKRNKSHLGNISVQTKIAVACLSRMSELYGLTCPIGRKSSEEAPVRYLPVAVSKRDTYNFYFDEWNTVLTSILQELSTSTPRTTPLEEDSFYRIMSKYFPQLSISKGGSGYYDTCFSMNFEACERCIGTAQARCSF